MKEAGYEDHVLPLHGFALGSADPTDKFDICQLNQIVIYHKIEPVEENCLWPHLEKYHDDCQSSKEEWERKLSKCNKALWYRV